MFNLSGSEIIVILLLALVVLGPEKLPDALRRAGRTYAELKKMGNSFQDEMRSVIDEPVKEMRETADLLRSQASFPDVDPKKAGSGGRAAGQLPAAPKTAAIPATPVSQPNPPSTNGESAAEVNQPADDDRSAVDGDRAAPSAAGEDDEALINRTLSGRTGPPAGDAGP